MTPSRARILRAAALGEPPEVLTLSEPPRTAKLIRRALVEAEQQASELLQKAHAEANQVRAQAAREAASVRLLAETEGRANAIAELSARLLIFQKREQMALEARLDDLVRLATVLAERLLGQALELQPELVTQLAQQALRETRGARRVTISAHPEDAKLLGQAIDNLGYAHSVSLDSDSTLERGHLRLKTDIGELDAELMPQLERLALKLRESIDDELGSQP